MSEQNMIMQQISTMAKREGYQVCTEHVANPLVREVERLRKQLAESHAEGR